MGSRGYALMITWESKTFPKQPAIAATKNEPNQSKIQWLKHVLWWSMKPCLLCPVVI
ncbi:hypothetical protein HBH56_066360 [Parastagonospora nodorum]|uniref:Uncharacterized protein n=1 Tax=Phaeosphaeria nodorum (strain SN15 / ATCC MYA-4574 / FGSC 10173) TaxID=321614 RepID=A0A7U2EYD8_PHANO|nr:hypothetical protein HBH56_066360 [Parastagonospora nodorum]QRC93335.1 hypothetical protein JI435_403640 [Parastagonospora nodorum SN15]KAH3932194.1 hypothetical protein HBH54_081730 [Parastagonospora nodorum]KAH3954600.1 hypothetical protein HBH53_012650 [Parastagonospora nodorum]KAH4005131.1 hypothetical protein HBI10_043700 [Parastagonospora nodorum]